VALQIGSLANSAGVGGGAIFVPLLQAVVGFGEAKQINGQLVRKS
jgi:uncharacterized membrane protein YfcA